jgi:hypothetical protein
LLTYPTHFYREKNIHSLKVSDALNKFRYRKKYAGTSPSSVVSAAGCQGCSLSSLSAVTPSDIPLPRICLKLAEASAPSKNALWRNKISTTMILDLNKGGHGLNAGLYRLYNDC